MPLDKEKYCKWLDLFYTEEVCPWCRSPEHCEKHHMIRGDDYCPECNGEKL